jgi:hypothetical protein
LPAEKRVEIMDDLLDALVRLNARLEGLERRIAALERSAPASLSAMPTPAFSSGAARSEKFGLLQDRGVFPVVGKAMLGIAGAYVLRAVAESGSFPKLAIVALALAYAGSWLVWSVRVPAVERFAGTAYAATAALILAPMLAELRLRVQVLPDAATAILLAVFVLTAWGLAWKNNVGPILWVAGVTGVLTALVLLIATRDFLPYLAALLLMALASEGAAARNRWLSLRFLIAPAIDLAIWIWIYIYSLPAGSRLEYTPLKTAVVLALPSLAFLIYAASIAFRNIALRQRITRFEIGQATVGFLLAAFAWFEFAPAQLAGFGVSCWLFSAACYTAATLCFAHVPEERNYQVYGTWGIALLLLGSFFTLSWPLLAAFLSLAAMAAIWAGVRASRVMLGVHGIVYLLVAALASELLRYVGQALAGTCPGRPAWSLWIVALSVLVCYHMARQFDGELWPRQLLRGLPAILGASATAAFLVSAAANLAALRMGPDASRIAVIRTLMICALALGLAFAGARWQRSELVWTAYGGLAFVALKLPLEDLQLSHSGPAAISIFLYAIALIVVPRLARPKRHPGAS